MGMPFRCADFAHCSVMSDKCYPHVCDCGRRYARKRGLDRHLKFGCGKGSSFRCPYPDCSSIFHREDCLRRHLVSIHRPNRGSSL